MRPTGSAPFTPVDARVLMITATTDEEWPAMVDLAESLRRHGMAVSLLAVGPQVAAADRKRLESVPDLYLEQALAIDPGDLSDVEWLLDLEGRHRVSVVHITDPALAAVPWSAPVLLAPAGRISGPATPGGWVAAAAHVDMLVAPSRTRLNTHMRLFGRPSLRQVIHLGRAAHHFRCAGREPFVLACGAYDDPSRGIAAVDRVAAALDWPVVIGVPAAAEGKVPPRRPRGAHCIRLADGRERARWMAQASVYVAPARDSGFGLDVLEAAFCGCALVLSDIPAFRELWQGAALFVRGDDETALARALASLGDDPKLRGKMAQAARHRAFVYRASAAARAYRAAYARLIGEGEAWQSSFATVSDVAARSGRSGTA